MNKLIKVLDKRVKKADTGTGRFSAKMRTISTDSTLTPPPNSPLWSLKVVLNSGSSSSNNTTVAVDLIVSSDTTPSGPPRVHRRRALQHILQDIVSSDEDL